MEEPVAVQVARCVDRDPVLGEALGRGVLNLRRGARWLIESKGLDATEEAVVSALRRYPAEEYQDVVDKALSGCQVATRDQLALVACKRTTHVGKRLRELKSAPRYWAVWPSDYEFLVLVERKALEQVTQVVKDEVLSVVEGVGVVSVDAGKTRGVARAAHLLLDQLERRGIHILGAYGSGGAWSFVVAQNQIVQAFEIVHHEAYG